MTDTPDHLSQRLFQDGQKTIDYFRGLPKEQWERVIYTEGSQWKVREILAHFVVSEAANAQVVEDIVHGGPGAPADFKLNEFNERKVNELEGMPADVLLAQFERLRLEVCRMAAQLELADLEKRGRHPYFGIGTVKEILKLIYRHNQIHLRDIRKAAGS